MFHVQSEVTIGPRAQICTQLFVEGAVLATARRPLATETPSTEVEELMRSQHKTLLHELCRGRYDAWLASQSSAAQSSAELDVRPPLATQSRTIHRRNAALEVQVRVDADAHEVVTVVSCAGEVIAVRRISYESTHTDAEVQSRMDAELEAMIAKVRRGGVDPRLPAFVFVPPPLPR